MQLGSAIGPLPDRVVTSGLDRVVRDYLSGQDDAAKQMLAILNGMQDIMGQLASVAAAIAQIPAPVVNVPAPVVNVESPNVSVDVPAQEAAQVTVQLPEEKPERSRKRVVRDAQGLIVEIIEEPLGDA